MRLSILKLLGLLIFFGYYDFNHCIRMLKVTPGIPTITYVDENYMKDVIVKTRRNGRRTEYALNIEFTNLHTWANHNISMHYIFYEYLHNEYRRSFVELHFKICDLMLHDPYMGLVFRMCGLTTCPLPPGKKIMSNITFNQQFPSVVPFEKAKCEHIIKVEPSGKMIVKGDITLTLKMKEI